MRKTVVASAAILAASALFLPANNANAATTIVTIGVQAGALSISAPAAASLTLNGLSYSGQTGNVIVTDQRGQLLATWTATASLSDFVNGTSTVPASNVSYTNLVASIPSGGLLPLTVVVFTPLLSMSNSAAPVAVGTSALGSNNAQWNPTLTVPANLFLASGSYTANLVHSVS
ncbi:hypothetical protein [Antrihabitans stalactiti]|uniref:WxL domain-containing protein n=1 Tax=Antrihabitans stalactiti TaxID=2584121 RepID=A0A848KH14_9NOCA|nr:hypothetical protein [Antrihabitans stalactiti]NMN97461.1 hypothetical protein [Antrihabitans stalactiti]